MTIASDAQAPTIVLFDEPLPSRADPVALLGGKGANLAEMTQALQLRVPPGFTITTRVCHDFLSGGWPAGLDTSLEEYLDRLGGVLGERLGSAESPLLVSVRSGAPVSMPGMMDTLLDIGMTPEIRDALARRATPAFAADTWLRFNRMYAEIVLGVPAHDLAGAANHDDTVDGMLAAADRVRALADGHGGIPGDPLDQVRGAIAAVFRSWRSERAKAFRLREGIDESLGTAVTVQAMVFGNLGPRSGTGVAFTRDPATGAPGPYGDYLSGAQGEDVVAGDHSVTGISSLKDSLPEVYDELVQVLDRLERHYRDMCDVEFTVSDGTLYILQTRVGRRSPLAAVRIAIAMAQDPSFPLSRAEAVARIDPATLRQLSAIGEVRPGTTPLARGLAASPGIGTGLLCCDPDRAADMASRGISVVLARAETSPADIHGMVGASGLVTALGGLASHAAVVARSWAIPAVTGVEEMTVLATGIEIGGAFIAEGEMLTVDGATGAFYAGDQRSESSVEHEEVATLRAWAAELGIEPGTLAPASDTPGRSADITLYELARTVQLKGLCTPERAAAALAAAEARIEEMLADHDTVFQATPRGFMLTPDGREWATDQLRAERATADEAVLRHTYEAFLEINHRFKEVVSRWQVASADSPADPGWEDVVEAVSEIHDRLGPILQTNSGQAPRLASYARRFSGALDALRSGDRSMLAAPLKDSYHTVWFEYHEELIALCGRDRADEEK